MIRALAAAGLCWLAFGCDERQTQPAPPVAVAPVRTAPVRVEPTTPAPTPKVALTLVLIRAARRTNFNVSPCWEKSFRPFAK